MERSPDEIIKFLDKLKESHLKYCNVKSLSYRLEGEEVINAAQKQQLENCQSVAERNDLFHQFLRGNPAPETLKGAAKVLKNAPGTTNMNKRCAKIIEDFLDGIDPAQSLEAMERSCDKIIEFLDKLMESHLTYCNVKSLSYRLEGEQVINAAQKQQMNQCLSNAEANELFHQFLREDPAPETLKGAAKVLENAPGTTSMNRRCATAIDHFLEIDPDLLLEEPPPYQLQPPAVAVTTREPPPYQSPPYQPYAVAVTTRAQPQQGHPSAQGPVVDQQDSPDGEEDDLSIN